MKELFLSCVNNRKIVNIHLRYEIILKKCRSEKKIHRTFLKLLTIVKPKQAGTCGRGIRNEPMSNH